MKTGSWYQSFILNMMIITTKNNDDFTLSPWLTFLLIYLKVSPELLLNFDTARVWTHEPSWLYCGTGQHTKCTELQRQINCQVLTFMESFMQNVLKLSSLNTLIWMRQCNFWTWEWNYSYILESSIQLPIFLNLLKTFCS